METIEIILAAAGIPSAIFGLLIWYFKRSIDKRDAKKEERDKNVEKFMVISLQEIRAVGVLSVATARAVQRIPDAKCNGDMTDALEKAAKIQNEEKDFLVKQGIDHLFGGL